MAYSNKYGVARKIRIPLTKRGVVDHAVSADWTPAAGDVKISKDGGAAANVTNLPTNIASGNSSLWEFSLTATELQAAQVNVTIADSATKAIEDDHFEIETYGHGSAEIVQGLSRNQAKTGFMFFMTDSTTHAPATGLTVSVTRSLDGAAFAAGTLGAVSEVSAGWYKCDFAAADLDAQQVIFKATATGADARNVEIWTRA